MNPLVQEALGSIIRWLLALGAGLLVQRGVWSEAQALQYVSATTLALLALGWSLWQKYQSRLKLVTALANPKPTTESAVEFKVKVGETPSVSTPKTEIPEAPRV